MSNYRDDTQETAFASDSVWMGVGFITVDSAIATASLLFGLSLIHSESAIASDEIFESTLLTINELAIASDEITGKKSLELMTIESATAVGEQVFSRIVAVIEESAIAADNITDRSGSLTIESARISDSEIGVRRAYSLVDETAKAIDFTAQFASSLIIESALANDYLIDKAKYSSLILERSEASDLIVLSARRSSSLVREFALANDYLLGGVSASQVVVEVAVAEDFILGAEEFGQIWTANTDNWPMSHFSGLPFDGISVVNGTLYGTNSNGVYAVNGASSMVSASVVTGKIDLSGDGLVHPLGAFIEYEMIGDSTDLPSAEMLVTSTQSGIPESYQYPLIGKSASHLTNGRFKFGRGLRGRHFSFFFNH